MHAGNRLQIVAFVLLLPALLCFAVAHRANAEELKKRVLYNFDGDGCMWTKANGTVPTAIDVDDVRRLIEEVAYEGSQVNTILVCVGAQVMYYPTQVGTMRGTLCTPEQRANWPATEIQRFENMNAFFDAGIDPYAVMLAEAKNKGLESLLTFRMNDAHGNDFLKTQFWNDHPEYRLGAALDFWHPEVRDYVFSLIEEAVQRYDCDGIELDFNRFPTFFQTGTTQERVERINSLVSQVRALLDAESLKRGRHLILTARVPSNYGSTPPTYETSLALGCDPVAWVENGWLDYLTVSEFLFERGDLPIASWKERVSGIPVYGGIECTAGPADDQVLTADQYRLAAYRLWEQGADGVYLFNFFTPREVGDEPHFEVLADMGPRDEPPPVTVARLDGPTRFGESLVTLPQVTVGDEGAVEFEFQADAISGSMWYLADVFGGNKGEYRLQLAADQLQAILWSSGKYVAQWTTPFTDTTQWHSVRMAWKNGERTQITFDGATAELTNAGPLADFTSGPGIHTLGGYPNSQLPFRFDGRIRQLKLYDTYADSPTPVVVHEGPTELGGVSMHPLSAVSIGSEGTVELEFKADSTDEGCIWYLADVWSGKNGEYRLYLDDDTLNGALWNQGAYSAQLSVPFDDTARWHRLKLTWKEGEETLLMVDGVAVSVANGSPLGQFGSGPGMHVLGAYPSGGSGSSFFRGMTRNVRVRNYYDASAPLPGDLNADGMVGSNDLDIVRANWGRTVVPGDAAQGDASGDGSVGGDDLDLVRANWGGGAPAYVPEPETVALLTLGVLQAGIGRAAKNRHPQSRLPDRGAAPCLCTPFSRTLK